jgi:protoheme IX farnesyltransferase
MDMKYLINRLKLYFSLLKSLQTALLTMTGIAGFISARCPVTHGTTMVSMILSLILTISGSTVLNMWYDHDIDKVMDRTHHRPLSEGQISQKNALIFGITLSTAGVVLGLILSPLYGIILLAGIFFDVVVYTVWLKRKTCWSIVWGGFAGGMPILAGRALGLGRVDDIGILLALSVLFWIPTHILSFSMRYEKDYALAKIPTFPSTYGHDVTRKVIAFSSIIAGALISSAAILIEIQQSFLYTLGVLSGGLMIWAFLMVVRPSNKLNFGLFKYASVYMLAVMILLAL